MARPKKVKAFDPATNGRFVKVKDTFKNNLFHPSRYPAARQGWNDKTLGLGYSSQYERNRASFQYMYELGRAAATHWAASGNKPILWRNHLEIPEAYREMVIQYENELMPPNVEPTLEPPLPQEEQISVF
jgi:hypothetical protein